MKNVNGSLMYLSSGARYTVKLVEADWPSGQPRSLNAPPEGSTQVRWFGTAQAGAGTLRFDVGLPNPPAKKAEGN